MKLQDGNPSPSRLANKNPLLFQNPVPFLFERQRRVVHLRNFVLRLRIDDFDLYVTGGEYCALRLNSQF